MFKLFRKSEPAEPKPDTKLLRLPSMPAAIYAIGDIHGRLDLLQKLEQLIIADGANIAGPKLIVSLGDLIDRSTGSSGVIEHFMSPAPKGFTRIAIRGNHEDMMIKFIKDPSDNMNWLVWGGTETLLSYGLKPDAEGNFSASPSKLSHMTEAAVPQEHQTFLKNLPVALEVGRYRFAHATYELGLPLEQQTPSTLMWGDANDTDAYQGENFLIHGHVIVNEVEQHPNRINIDTGAYKTGKLTAARILRDDDTIVLFQT